MLFVLDLPVSHNLLSLSPFLLEDNKDLVNNLNCVATSSAEDEERVPVLQKELTECTIIANELMKEQEQEQGRPQQEMPNSEEAISSLEGQLQVSGLEV